MLQPEQLPYGVLDLLARACYQSTVSGEDGTGCFLGGGCDGEAGRLAGDDGGGVDGGNDRVWAGGAEDERASGHVCAGGAEQVGDGLDGAGGGR